LSSCVNTEHSEDVIQDIIDFVEQRLKCNVSTLNGNEEAPVPTQDTTTTETTNNFRSSEGTDLCTSSSNVYVDVNDDIAVADTSFPPPTSTFREVGLKELDQYCKAITSSKATVLGVLKKEMATSFLNVLPENIHDILKEKSNKLKEALEEPSWPEASFICPNLHSFIVDLMKSPHARREHKTRDNRLSYVNNCLDLLKSGERSFHDVRDAIISEFLWIDQNLRVLIAISDTTDDLKDVLSKVRQQLYDTDVLKVENLRSEANIIIDEMASVRFNSSRCTVDEVYASMVSKICGLSKSGHNRLSKCGTFSCRTTAKTYSKKLTSYFQSLRKEICGIISKYCSESVIAIIQIDNLNHLQFKRIVSSQQSLTRNIPSISIICKYQEILDFVDKQFDSEDGVALKIPEENDIIEGLDGNLDRYVETNNLHSVQDKCFKNQHLRNFIPVPSVAGRSSSLQDIRDKVICDTIIKDLQLHNKEFVLVCDTEILLLITNLLFNADADLEEIMKNIILALPIFHMQMHVLKNLSLDKTFQILFFLQYLFSFIGYRKKVMQERYMEIYTNKNDNENCTSLG
jgi:hypothetical protein